ncbi:hypothetical protein ONZ45_g5360 [Pleurotus djamor]|nr:hypothetical protein ONZ45_g5360 [Pleurotus djamor]
MDRLLFGVFMAMAERERKGWALMDIGGYGSSSCGSSASTVFFENVSHLPSLYPSLDPKLASHSTNIPAYDRVGGGKGR